MQRSEMLTPLFASISSLKGVGKVLEERLGKLAGPLVRDVVFLMPTGCIDRRSMPDLDDICHPQFITSIIQVIEHIPPPPRTKRPYEIRCRNDSGRISLLFFHSKTSYLQGLLPAGAKRVVSGYAERFDGMLRMIHPDCIVTQDQLSSVQRLEAVYPLTKGVAQKKIQMLVQQSLALTPELPDWLLLQEGVGNDSNELLGQKSLSGHGIKEGWKGWKTSLEQLHKPEELEFCGVNSPARRRLAYDELLAYQLALSVSRQVVKRKAGRRICGNGQLCEALESALPFSLTGGQKGVVADIIHDMSKPHRMLRLLQGDVGSGKTIVALMALLTAVEAGSQSALMSPTEILSNQHYQWIKDIIELSKLDINVAILTGRIKGAKRRKILSELESGEIDILVGTHALFQDAVCFHDLSLAVIDEQHRFGVKQRLALSMKGEGVDILLMTATPIPRTLTMTLYGDMDVSILKEKPAGRKKIDTRVMPVLRQDEIIAGLERVIARGEQIYWVCPLIESTEEEKSKQDPISDKKELEAAEERFDYLLKFFPRRVGLVHGRMGGEEKDAIMKEFKSGNLDILVATTVIEVGVDVPKATVIVIEQAQKFGLSQLHQLRGRVGRGSVESRCILLYGQELTENGKQRLQIMRETDDGFRIAEEDLLLRGSGEVLGTRQSGLPHFRLAILPDHNDLLLEAHSDAAEYIQKDPKLESERGMALRTLLHLFDYDSHLRYVYSG